MHDLRSVARGRKVHSHNVPAVFSGFPNVRTRSFLSSCAVKKLTHLSPHCSTDTDTHIKKHSLTSGFGETPLPWITVTVYVEWTATPPPPPSPSAAFIPFGLYSLQSAVPESVRTFSEERAGKLRYGLRQGETEGRCRGQSRREREGGGCGWMGAGWVPSILEQVRLWQVGERVPGVTAWDRWIWVKLVNEHTAQLSWFPKLLLKSFYWQLWMLGSHCEHPREVIWALIVQKKVVFNCTAPDNWFKTKRKKENIREMISFLRSVNLTRHHVCAQGLKICMWW